MSQLGFVPLQIEKGTRTVASQPAEWKHWAKFQQTFEKKQPNAITSISSNHNTKNNVFYAAGHIVEMYSARKNEATKIFAKFKENVTALCTRSDARMFAVGMQSGVVQVLDVKHRLTLRSFDNHKKRVNALDYSSFNDLYSGGDDMTIRKFDVSSGSVVHSFARAHSDYIKSIQSLQENYIATAGYDGKIKFWDFRVQKSAAMEFNHESPVEAIDRYPSGLSVVSCGGTVVKVWDVRTSRQIHSCEGNKKPVTCVRVLQSGERFLTGSLDQHLKVYSTDTFQLTYNEKYPDAILSLDCTYNQQLLAVGLNSGQLSIKKSGVVEQPQSDDEKQIEQLIPQFMRLHQKTTPVYNTSFFYRGIYAEPEAYDEKVERIGQKHGFYDRCLKKFEYKKALLGAIENRQIDVLASLLLELEQRGSLQRTVKALDTEQVSLFLKAISQRIDHPKFRGVLLRLTSQLWEQFSLQQGVRNDWLTLLSHLSKQVQVQRESLELLGQLQTISQCMGN